MLKGVKSPKKSKTTTDFELAMDLVKNLRGQYIIGQALAIATREIEGREKHLQEPSNVADMKLLGEQVFQVGYVPHTLPSMSADERLTDYVKKFAKNNNAD